MASQLLEGRAVIIEPPRFERDGFAIVSCHVTADDQEHDGVTVKGQFGAVRVGCAYDVAARWIDHPRWGRQLELVRCVLSVPATPDALAAYLAASVKGVGDVTAARIAAACPPDTPPIDWLSTEPLPEVPLVSPELLAACQRQLAADGACAVAELELRGLLGGLEGFGDRRIAACIATWGGRAADAVREDPYQLRQIPGIGWRLADRVATECIGLAADDPRRVAAGYETALEEAEREGHMGLPEQRAQSAARALLGAGVDVGEPAQHGLQIDRGLAYRPCALRAESSVAQTFLGWAQMRPVARRVPVGSLDPSQHAAANLIAGAALACLTGGPGTGKTTTIRSLLAALPDRVALCAPTGKAARRMTEQTGHEARTLHSMLRLADDASDINPRDEFLTASLVIVDESSMLDMYLAARLLQALRPGQRLLLVGDPQQLCPVGPGQPFVRLVRSGVCPVGHLDVVHRQEGGRLLDLIHAIGRGDQRTVRELMTDTPDGDLRVLRTEDDGTIHRWMAQLVGQGGRLEQAGVAEDDWQVVSPTNTRGPLSVAKINDRLQEVLRDKAPTAAQLAAAGWTSDEAPRYRASDRVVFTANKSLSAVDGGDVSVVNGEQARVASVTHEGVGTAIVDLVTGQQIRASMAAPWLQLAYAVTVHKAQGSEWPTVILPLHRTMPGHMLTREWVYTACSRARERLIVIGDPGLLVAAAGRPAPERMGRLGVRMMEAR